MSSSEGDVAMKDPADKINEDNIQKDVDAVKHDLSNLADQIVDALDALAGSAEKRARRGYKQARSSAESVVSDLGKQSNAALDHARNSAAALADTLEDSVQQRPLAAVGLALGLGLLIGLTWRR